MILVEGAPRLGDVDRVFDVGRPGELDQPVQIRAHHRVLAGAFGHALEALQFLARLLFHLLGHFRFGDRLVELGDLARRLVAVAELLLDRAHLLAQQVLAVAVVDRCLGALVDLARHLQNLDAVGKKIEQLVETCLQVERFQQRLFFLDADVHQSGDEVGEPCRPLDALQRRDHFLGHLWQQAQDLDRPLLEIERAALDIDVGLDGFVDQLHLRGQHRIAVEELQRPKALHALADHMVRAVGCGHIAQHRRGGTHPVQVVGSRLVGVAPALQKNAQRSLQPHGLLHRRPRTLAVDHQGHHHAREQDDIAHRDDDQRVVGQRARDGLALALALRRECVGPRGRVGAGRDGSASGWFVHRGPV